MKLSKKQHKVYDVIISILAIAAVVLVLVDLSQELTSWQKTADKIILTIFTLDYAIRFFNAPCKSAFFRENICDLIAIFPFHTLFRAFKITALSRMVRFAKIPRLFAFLYRPLRKATRFLNTNGFKYVLFITAFMILSGGILIHFAEGMSYEDGIWWAFVTATTVGYGDISPSTFYGRLIAMALMLVGIGLIGTVTSTLTSYFLKIQKKDTKNQTLEMVKNQLENFDQLSDEDLDVICNILKALKKSQSD